MAKPSDRLAAALDAARLAALGCCAPDPDFCPPDTRSLVLIGPEGGSGWWDLVTASPEWQDGAPDPLDRWSKRILGRVAADLGGAALFPSDGPPWPPFRRWALATGRITTSPAGLLIHPQTGLWLSFRGALALPFALDMPPLASPCAACTTRPCLAACPAGAMGAKDYDVPRCRAWLDTPPGADCMTRGCTVRRACPASQSHARLDAQSAYHMRQFHR